MSEDIVVCGLSVRYWVDLFEGCHTKDGFGAAIQFSWPDDCCYLDQYSITVYMFNIIEEQLGKINSERAKKRARKK